MANLVTKNALKLTYGDIEITKNFRGRNPRTPAPKGPLTWPGRRLSPHFQNSGYATASNVHCSIMQPSRGAATRRNVCHLPYSQQQKLIVHRLRRFVQTAERRFRGQEAES